MSNFSLSLLLGEHSRTEARQMYSQMIRKIRGLASNRTSRVDLAVGRLCVRSLVGRV